MKKDFKPQEKKSNGAGSLGLIKKITKKRLMVNVVKEKIENSTMHAIPNIVRTDYWTIKIFWIILFLTGCGFTVYCRVLFCSYHLYLNLVFTFFLRLYDFIDIILQI
jgi:hypothetical protein